MLRCCRPFYEYSGANFPILGMPRPGIVRNRIQTNDALLKRNRQSSSFSLSPWKIQLHMPMKSPCFIVCPGFTLKLCCGKWYKLIHWSLCPRTFETTKFDGVLTFSSGFPAGPLLSIFVTTNSIGFRMGLAKLSSSCLSELSRRVARLSRRSLIRKS